MAPTDSPLPSARVAAITVSYGSLAVLPALLKSIPAASERPTLVLVADNKAQDATNNARELSQEFGARYVPLASNVGYGSGIQAAARDLPPTIEWILVVNPDVVLEPHSIDT